LPQAFVDAVWGFHLRPAPGGRTRLVVRKLGRGPRVFTWPFDLLLGDPLHCIMQTRQFHNLRTRVDGSLHQSDRCQSTSAPWQQPGEAPAAGQHQDGQHQDE
jgi:hypothetical protein